MALTKEETLEGNKLISEFMGAIIKPLNYIRQEFIVAEFSEIIHGLHCHPLQDLKYHSSWDWLMPVVEKIQSRGYDVMIFNDEDGEQAIIYHAGFSYKRDEASLVVPNKPSRSVSKIYVVWTTVIEFIKWYSQKQ